MTGKFPSTRRRATYGPCKANWPRRLNQQLRSGGSRKTRPVPIPSRKSCRSIFCSLQASLIGRSLSCVRLCGGNLPGEMATKYDEAISSGRVSRLSCPDCRHRIQSLARGNGLGFTGSQTLSAIIRNGAVDDGAAIDAFPCVKHEKEIREPF
jgi:hypothetical protein